MIEAIVTVKVNTLIFPIWAADQLHKELVKTSITWQIHLKVIMCSIKSLHFTLIAKSVQIKNVSKITWWMTG